MQNFPGYSRAAIPQIFPLQSIQSMFLLIFKTSSCHQTTLFQGIHEDAQITAGAPGGAQPYRSSRRSVSHPVVLLKVFLEVDDVGVVQADKDINLLENVISGVLVVTH